MTTLKEVRARFARDQGLPFADSLSERSILDALNEHGIKYRDRVFNPVTTIWGFLSQVLSEDHSCRDAVSGSSPTAPPAASRFARPTPPATVTPAAASPLPCCATLARRTAQQLQAGLPEGWKWNGRNVFIADGSHVSMPDTPENQAGYPQPVVQQPGIGFPLARVTVLLSLATGACHDLAIAPYAGKGTGETTLLRQMYDSLSPGDVVVADALFDNYFLACELRQRGIELVARVQAERVGSRTVESRPDGDIILWQRPNKPRGMTGEQYRRYPKSLLMRQVTVDARDKDNRAEQFKVVTTILDASIDGGQIGDLYERRWDGEVDIRSIKSTMQMDILRCKTPEMVHKEIWAHLLAYNLLRTVMAVAAGENGDGASRGELQGGQAGRDGVRPEDRGGAAGRTARADRRACWRSWRTTASATVRGAGSRGRQKRRPKPGARLNQTTSRGQAGAQSGEMVLARGEAVGHFLWLQAGRVARRCGTAGTALSG